MTKIQTLLALMEMEKERLNDIIDNKPLKEIITFDDIRTSRIGGIEWCIKTLHEIYYEEVNND